MQEWNGKLSASGMRIAVVVSRFNERITEKLLEGSIHAFTSLGGDSEKIAVVRVPGSFEIPQAAAKLAASENFDAVVCLGCLIRGETPHFDYLAQEVTRGIGEIALETGVPVTYGVLTTETVEQALNRSGVKYGNKGAEATAAAVEMASLFAQMGSE